MTKNQFILKWLGDTLQDAEINEVFSDLDKVIEAYSTKTPMPTYITKNPHTCPICGGRGLVSGDFYQQQQSTNYNTTVVVCQSCNGTGVIWG